MGFLSWMKRSESKAPETSAPTVAGNPTPLQQLFAEWTHDRRLANVRDATGREPESGPISKVPSHASQMRKAAPKTDHLKSRDISF